VVRQRHLIAIIGTFLIGCAVLLLVVSCAGTRSEAPKEQGHAEATSEVTSEQQELYGGPAYDRLRGGIGNDILHGGASGDFLEGGAGDDVIYGDDGADMIFGLEGEDVLYGGEGNDYLDGRDEGPKDTQPDEIYCGAGRDIAVAGKYDSVSGSCEVKDAPPKPGKPVRVD